MHTEYMCFNQRGDISTLNGSYLKLVDKFAYLGSSVTSTETDINTWLAKAWAGFDWLLVIWKSVLTDKIKRSFFQAAAVSIVQYGCTTCRLMKRMEKKVLRQLHQNAARIYWTSPGGSTPRSRNCIATYHLSRKLSTLDEIKRTRHVGHCWGIRDELISDMLLCTPSHGWTKQYDQRQDDQLEPTYISSVPIRDVTLKTCRK